MVQFLLASHGKMASGMKTSLDILLGASKNVTVFDAYVDESNVENKIREFLDSVNEEDQVILLSDLFGGSVNQMMFRFLERPNTYLVAGVNLALVLELVASSFEDFTKEKLQETVEMSRQAMTLVEFDQPEASEDFF